MGIETMTTGTQDSWGDAVRRAIVPSIAAGALSTATLAARGRLETGSAVAPTNSTAQWLWGEKAALQETASIKYTVSGYLIHQAAALLWATVYERVVVDGNGRRGPGRAVAAGVGVAALAMFTDYVLTPRRLMPGYEKRVSVGSLVAAYGAFAVGLALTDVLTARAPGARPADRIDPARLDG